MAATVGIMNGTLIGVYVDGTLITNLTGNTLNVNISLRDTTTKDSAGRKANLEGLTDWSIDAEGYFEEGAAYGFTDLFALYTSRASVVLKIASSNAGDSLYTGTAWMTSLSQDGPLEDNVSFSVSFEGSGALTEDTVT